MTSGIARVMRSTPDDVFATLSDGWLYPVWVVGAARMRAVAPEWPRQGSKIHHSFGAWPVLIDDETEVVEWSPPQRVRLRAKGGPIGRAVVAIEVREHPQGCVVRIGEEPVAGPTLAVPRALWAPLMRLRNRETLRRLAFLAEGRRREREEGAPTLRPDVPASSEATPGREAREAREDTASADEAERGAHDPASVDVPSGDAAGAAAGDERADDTAQDAAGDRADADRSAARTDSSG